VKNQLNVLVNIFSKYYTLI